MNQLTIFPELLNYSFFAPTFLRLAAGVLILFAGLERRNKEYKGLSVVYIITSILIITGLYTQVAVLAGIVLIKFEYYMARKSGSLTREKTALTIIMIVILLSLLLTGPGAFAFDLPL